MCSRVSFLNYTVNCNTVGWRCCLASLIPIDSTGMSPSPLTLSFVLKTFLLEYRLSSIWFVLKYLRIIRVGISYRVGVMPYSNYKLCENDDVLIEMTSENKNSRIHSWNVDWIWSWHGCCFYEVWPLVKQWMAIAGRIFSQWIICSCLNERKLKNTSAQRWAEVIVVVTKSNRCPWTQQQ